MSTKKAEIEARLRKILSRNPQLQDIITIEDQTKYPNGPEADYTLVVRLNYRLMYIDLDLNHKFVVYPMAIDNPLTKLELTLLEVCLNLAEQKKKIF